MIEHNLEVIKTADWIIARTGYLRGSHPNESAAPSSINSPGASGACRFGTETSEENARLG
jgi:hypothetical protein